MAGSNRKDAAEIQAFHIGVLRCYLSPNTGSNYKAGFKQGVHDVVGDLCEIHTFDPDGYNKRNDV